MSRYLVLDLVSGSELSHAQIAASTVREARSIACQRARQLRPSWLTARPIWCNGGAWHEHPDAPGGDPIGGYDVGDEGSATVVYQMPEGRS